MSASTDINNFVVKSAAMAIEDASTTSSTISYGADTAEMFGNVVVIAVNQPGPHVACAIAGEPIERWLQATSVDRQQRLYKQSPQYSQAPRWFPPPAVLTPTVGELDESLYADAETIDAMDQAEQRLADALRAELDADRDARLNYRP